MVEVFMGVFWAVVVFACLFIWFVSGYGTWAVICECVGRDCTKRRVNDSICGWVILAWPIALVLIPLCALCFFLTWLVSPNEDERLGEGKS
jgi:hypothetical protein